MDYRMVLKTSHVETSLATFRPTVVFTLCHPHGTHSRLPSESCSVWEVLLWSNIKQHKTSQGTLQSCPPYLPPTSTSKTQSTVSRAPCKVGEGTQTVRDGALRPVGSTAGKNGQQHCTRASVFLKNRAHLPRRQKKIKASSFKIPTQQKEK